MNNFNKSGQLFIAGLALVVFLTAIYAITTWHQPSLDSAKSNSSNTPASQLPNQNSMTPDLQAQPSSNQDINGGASSNSLQPQGSQSDTMMPADPSGCRGIYPSDATQAMCMAQ